MTVKWLITLSAYPQYQCVDQLLGSSSAVSQDGINKLIQHREETEVLARHKEREIPVMSVKLESLQASNCSVLEKKVEQHRKETGVLVGQGKMVTEDVIINCGPVITVTSESKQKGCLSVHEKTEHKGKLEKEVKVCMTGNK